MSFYLSSSFFILLAACIVPAAFLGLCERRMGAWRCLVSFAFVVSLFVHDAHGAISLSLFLLVSFLAMRATLASWVSGRKDLRIYRASMCATLAPLIIYKVGAVGGHNLLGFVGISYATFRAVQVLIEIRDGLIKEVSGVQYFLFLTFFPAITSGPIDRSRRFFGDLNRRLDRETYANMLALGIQYILWGAVLYFVCAVLVLPHYNPHPFYPEWSLIHNLADAAKSAYAYFLYLYFDFAGYSLMAVGTGYCFGIELPRNFRRPFLALDMKDFWSRWHISLSTWLRDYVFTRFTRFSIRRKLFGSRLQTACCAYMVNMVIMGAWHGLTVDYLVYGFYEGVVLALTEIVQRKSTIYRKYRDKPVFKIISWAITMNLVVVGMSLFSGQAHVIVGGMLHG